MKYKLLSLLLIPALLLVFTGKAEAWSSNPELNAKVNQVWVNWNYTVNPPFTGGTQTVEWKYGCYPDPNSGGCYAGVVICRNNSFFFGTCLQGYQAWVLKGYDELNVIAHEGGHVVCRKALNPPDFSEECAEKNAYKYVPEYPYPRVYTNIKSTPLLIK